MVDKKTYDENLRRTRKAAAEIGRMKNKYYSQMIKSYSRKQSGALRAAFYGRAADLLKDINFRVFDKYERARTRLPKVKIEDTIIIAGCPNVGKSQLVNAMSGHRIETATYPFTTKNLLIGYIKNRYVEIQLIDTPGILDRPLSERNAIEKRAILALKHLSKNVVFVIDPSETCGYPLEEQLRLRDEIIREFSPKMFTVATKKDVLEKEVPADAYINALDLKQAEELKQKIIKFFF
jgi:nucleolar GTP-binding protein